MQLLKSIFDSHVLLIVCGVAAAITAGLALMWSKHPVRWIVGLLAVGWVFLVLILDLEALNLDPKLPGEFYWWLRPWLLVLGLIVVFATPHLILELVGKRRTTETTEPSEEAPFSDLEAAWDEILLRLGQARFDAGNQSVFLLLARDEGLAADVIRASGMNLFASGPSSAEAPIHAFASAEGLFISCSGASAWSGRDDGAARLTWLCRKIEALNPEAPPLRGVAALFPLEEAASAEALQQVGPLRHDLQTIQGELRLRCPLIAVFCARDGRSGLHEFVARMPSGLRNSRCGFATPGDRPFDRGVANQGLSWFVQWLRSWSLNLMVQDFLATEGNGRLVELNAETRRNVPALATLVETAFSTHARAQPLLVRGCYFATCGPSPSNYAFVAGLVRGARSKMLGDALLTSWSREARDRDRRYKAAALALAAAAAAIAVPIWLMAVAPKLRATGPDGEGGLGWVVWAGLGALTVIWIVGLVLPMFRGRAGKPAKA